jgi:glycosyltransferase involved in cell wall biosynthesis
MKSNVLFLHKYFHQSGGIERVHKNLATSFAQHGVESYFYVMKSSGEDECGFVNLKMHFNATSCPEGSGFVRWKRDIKRLIIQQDIKVIISATEQANFLAFLIKLTSPKLKVVYTRHCAFEVEEQRVPARILRALYSLYALNGEIVAVSKCLQSQINASLLFASRSAHYIPNAVVSESMYSLSKEPPSIDIEKPYLIAVGRLATQKGFDLLVDAYAKALEIDSTIPTLLIVGDGEDKGALQAQVIQSGLENNVVLAGFVNNPYPLIKGATSLVLSSRYEGMPTVLIESLALDVPVIAFDCPTGPSEIIVSGENGELVEYLNTDELALAISKYSQLPQASLAKYVKPFEFDSVVKEYLRVSGIR